MTKDTLLCLHFRPKLPAKLSTCQVSAAIHAIPFLHMLLKYLKTHSLTLEALRQAAEYERLATISGLIKPNPIHPASDSAQVQEQKDS